MNRALVAVGALLAGAVLVSGEASAQRGFRGGGFGGGVRAGGFGGGFRAGGFGGGLGVGAFRGAAVGVRPGFGVSRGFYGGGWRYPSYGYYRRGWGYPSYGYWGGALAAGLALGAATYPYYGSGYYGYPYGSGYYGYPYYGAAYGGDCYWVTRRVVGPYGGVVVRRVQVCGY